MFELTAVSLAYYTKDKIVKNYFLQMLILQSKKDGITADTVCIL